MDSIYSESGKEANALAFDASGTLYFLDRQSDSVYYIDSSGQAVLYAEGLGVAQSGVAASPDMVFAPSAVLTSGENSEQNFRPIQKGALHPLTLAEMSNNPFSFSYETEKGKTYKVECSTDLIRWYEVDLVKGTGNEVKFTDKRQRLFQQQFYRVVLE